MRNNKLLIDGKWQDAVAGKTFRVINPATGQAVAEVGEGDASDIDLAVKAARKAFQETWGNSLPAERSKILHKVGEIFRARARELAELDTQEIGRPIRDTSAEALGLANWFEYYAGLTDMARGQTMPAGPDTLVYTRREPWGVVGAITPWNYPMSVAVMKVAPILASGNAMVLKPAKQSPSSALALGEICLEAGLPAGVLNVVTGQGSIAGSALAQHMDVDKIGFTGSTEVGREIMEMAARSNLKSVCLELGGKSPIVVFADANLEATLNAAIMSVFVNQGQTCTACTRLLVQDEIADQFVDALAKRAEQIIVGDPMNMATQMGALVTRQQWEKVKMYISEGQREGAKLVAGGSPPRDPALANGCFMRPTVFTEVNMGMRIAQEEIFGPVLSVIRFKDEGEAIRLGNQVTYGLAASVWTQDLGRAHRVAHRLEAGLLWVNTMYPGVLGVPVSGYKQSGIGAEFGLEGLEDYTRLKTVIVNLTGNMPRWDC